MSDMTYDMIGNVRHDINPMSSFGKLISRSRAGSSWALSSRAGSRGTHSSRLAAGCAAADGHTGYWDFQK